MQLLGIGEELVKRVMVYKTIFSRMIGIFLIIIIPVYLLGMIMNLLAMKTVKTEITQSMSTQVEYYLNDLEDSFLSTKMLQYDCLNDENLKKLAILWEVTGLYERQQSMIQLQNRLVTIRNSSQLIKDVTAHIEPIQKSISANNGIVDFRTKEFEEIRINDKRKGAQILFYENEIYMTTYDDGLYGSGSSMFSIVVQFNKEKLIETLSSLNKNADSGIVLIQKSGDEDMLFQSDTGRFIPWEILDKIIREENSSKSVKYDKNTYYVEQLYSKYLDAVLVKYVPEDLIMKPLKQIHAWLWVFSITSILISIIYSLSTYKYLHEPMTKLVKAFKKVEEGNMDVAISHEVNDEFEYLYRRFNDMVAKIGVLIDQVYMQKIMTQRAELKQLQSQINPHFLYNSFFLINTMARVGDDNLITFTKYLGEYFRYVTRNGTDVICLNEEVKHAGIFMELQKMRFTKRLTLSVSELPQEYEALMVPRLILQPIIENAFKYGIEKKKSGILSVDYVVLKNGLQVIFEDNGSEIDEVILKQLNDLMSSEGRSEEISGLKNIHRRIQLFFKGESGLLFDKSDLGGLKVVLTMDTENMDTIKGDEVIV